AVAQISGASAFIGSLPQGYDTIVGKEFCNGIDLSRGQWQKVALARLFMKRDPQIIVMDEPTASVDALAELELHQQFYGAVQAPFTFIVSHRLGSARFADLIVVLSDGALIEQGTHHE